MKRFFLLLVTVFIISNLAWASPVDPMEAKNLAQTFWSLHFPEQPRPVFEDISHNVGVENFYIFNNTNGPGFVLVSGDDCAIPILGYSGENSCIGGELPDNIRSWFGYYDGTIGAAVQNREVATPEIAEQWNTLRAGNLPEPQSVTAVSPLIATTWNQVAPYNNLCPGTGSNKPYVGCVATAMAQLMKYYNWPTTGTGSYSYYCNNGTYNYGTLTANFGATTYDWANMLNSYPNANSGTTTQQNAVATLMYHCGVSVNMSYSPEWSGAFLADCEVASTYPSYPTAEKALKNYFKYSPSLVGAAKANYTNAQWISMLKNDLDQQRPVLYDGTDQNGQGGHCFVCDGYDNSNNFHFNWGWEGAYNGYFVITNLTPGPGGAGAGNLNYSYNQSALFGVVPNNGSTPDPSGCTYLHYPLPGTLNFYTFQNNGGYVAGTNIYGETAKADYFTYSGSGTVEKLNVTFGAIDGVSGSINFTVWADNNGTPGNVIGSKTVTLSTIYTTAVNLGGNYECVFDNPITVNGNFFAGIDFSNANSAIGIYTNTAGDTANTGWSLSSNGQWVPYNSPNHVGTSLTHAIHPYVCATSGPTPPDPNTDLHVYSDYTYTPNPLQQNQSVSVQVSVANAGSGDFTGTIKLALLTANNSEAQVIDQVSGTLNTMSYATLQYNGTVTVPAGTYQMAVLSQASGQSTWTLLGNNFSYPNPITVTVTGGSTPPDPSGCTYLHYPLPGTLTVYDAEDGGYVSGSNAYGDEAKADYFTYSGSGSIEKIKITIGAMDGTQGSVVFKVWADNNGVPGSVLGSKTVTLSEIYNNMNANSEYECIFSNPIAISGNFFAGLDVTNATSYFGLATTTNGTAANTGWEYYDNDWWTYEETWELSLTNAIFPYVCSGTGPTPPDPNTSLNVYSDFTYTPNPLQQNQSVSVEVNVANTGSSSFNGTLKLVLLDANNFEAQVIGQSNITLNTMSFFNYQFSGTVTVPAGTYQMAVYAQATGQSTWTLVGNGLNYPNPVSVTVTGGSTPPVNDFHLVMYEAFSYMPNPMQQNQSVTVNASVGNSGTSNFEGSFKLVLLNANNFEAQTIGQQSLSSPLTSMLYTPLTFSGTITVPAGTYQMALYYQATGESTWTLVGNDFGVDNPVSVTVTGGSTPPVNDVDLNMYSNFLYTPNPLRQNTVAYISASVINMGNTAFTGSLRLALETSNDEYVQTIQQLSVNTPVAPNGNTQFNFSGNITAEPGFYNLILYYKPDGASNWIAVGSNYNASYQNPKSVLVAYPDGIEDRTIDAVKLRPNPATDHFCLDVSDQTIDNVEIFTLTGQIVHTQKNVMSGENIDISFLKSGVYFVRFETSGRVGTQKLIVQ